MVVYVERVFINNFIVDACLLSAADKTARCNSPKGRIFFGATVGAVFSLLSPLLQIPSGALFAVKTAVGGVIAKCGVKTAGVKRFSLSYLLFLGYTFLFGGVLTGVYGMMERPVFTEKVPFYLLFSGAYLLFRLVGTAFFAGKKITSVPALYYRANLTLGGVSAHCRAYLDTGNRLEKDGEPVLVCSKKIAERFLTPKTARTLSELAVTTATGTEFLPLLQLDRAELTAQNAAFSLRAPYLVVMNGAALSAAGCDLLIGVEALTASLAEKPESTDIRKNSRIK